MTKIVISQPVFFPWPGFFSHLLTADLVVWLDDAQFSKGWFTNRCQIANSTSRERWLTIPVTSSSHFKCINELTPCRHFFDDHIELLESYYRNAPFFDSMIDIYATAMNKSANPLVELLIFGVQITFEAMHGYPLQSTLSSSLGINGNGSDRVLSICKKLGGSQYITGHGARNYLDHARFEREGVEVLYMDYDVVPWRCLKTKLSILDLIAHVGMRNAYEYYSPKTIHWSDFVS